jgi:hypothetical protein
MRLSVASRGLVPGLVIFALAAGACAHGSDAGKPADPYVASAVASFRGWMDKLPRCAPSQERPDMPAYRRDDGTDAVEVRGRLTLAAAPQCTQVECGATACCNSCFPTWVVVPEASDAPRELPIQKSGADRPLTAVVKDCKLDAIRGQLPATRVIVSGFLERDVIIRATTCVIVEPPAPAK